MLIVVALAANCLAIVYSTRFLFGHDDVFADQEMRVILGVTIALYWASCAQYLEYFPRFYLLIWTLKVGVPRVLQFFLGIAPFFVGYALLGMTLFGDEVDLFGSFSSTCCTLFAVVNGDSILDVFDALAFFFPIGDIYLYVYIMIFMYVVLMSVIAIVEEAFFDSLRSQGLNYGQSQQRQNDYEELVKKTESSSRSRGRNGATSGIQRVETTTGLPRRNSVFTDDTSIGSGPVPNVGLPPLIDSKGQPRNRTASKSIDIAPSSVDILGIDTSGSSDHLVPSQNNSYTSYSILGSSPSTATFQSRLLPPKLREVLRNVNARDERSSSSSDESDDDNEEVKDIQSENQSPK